jgi:PAP2 superfamily
MNGRRFRGLAVVIVTFSLAARGQNTCSSASHAYLHISSIRPGELSLADGPNDSRTEVPKVKNGLLSRTLHRGLQDQKEIYSAPFQRRNLKWDALFLAGTGALLATDERASTALSSKHLDLSRNISNAGLIGTAAAVGGIWISGIKTHDDHARETGILSLEALANTSTVYAATQLLAGRERPLEGTGEGRFWQSNRLDSAFPSGHAIFTWSMAAVVAHEYPRPWVRWLAYGTAAAVSATRFTGKEHFPCDVVVGGALGYLIGTHIFHSHCQVGMSDVCR